MEDSYMASKEKGDKRELESRDNKRTIRKRTNKERKGLDTGREDKKRKDGSQKATDDTLKTEASAERVDPDS